MHNVRYYVRCRVVCVRVRVRPKRPEKQNNMKTHTFAFVSYVPYIVFVVVLCMVLFRTAPEKRFGRFPVDRHGPEAAQT